MTTQSPQVFEPLLDQILAGTLTEPGTLANILRALLICRRRYNDPDQVAGRMQNITVDGWAGDYITTSPNTTSDRLGGVVFSNFFTLASQKARIEAGITFLTPIVGSVVGSYPPIPPLFNGTIPDSTHYRIDTMGNQILPGMP